MYTPRTYRHKVYNTKETTLQEVCDKEPMESHWILVKVVKISDIESVAIFETN